jgi:hypothetical protein
VTEPRALVEWKPRDTPLPVRAVVASGFEAKVLGRKLATLDDDVLRGLAAVAGDDVLVVLGDETALPWIDGVLYLGRDESAPNLLLPTALAPTLPPALLEAAIRKVAPQASPIAVVPAPARLIPCGAARAIDRTQLAVWLVAT